MRFFRKQTLFYFFSCLLFSLSAVKVKAQNDPSYTSMMRDSALLIKGDSIQAGKLLSVQDTVFFNPSLKPLILRTNSIGNIISFRINEYSNKVLPDSFQATVKIRVIYIDKNNLKDSITEKTLTIDYNKNKIYNSRAIFSFQNAYSVQVKVLDLTTTYAAKNVVAPFLELENRIVIDRDYVMSCTNDAIRSVQKDPSTIAEYGDLKVSWIPNRVSEIYDLEWTYLDKSALDNGIYNTNGILDPNLMFKNNASRVSIKGSSYMIPLLYDGDGSLFFRVRGVQPDASGELQTTDWSSSYISQGGLGRYDFTGHERALNWQATTSFAEEGKRKSVVQYFDGSLRGRQVVTRDNTTGTTVVAETFYDQQGRPVIQIMPAPTLSKLIKYTPGFNVADMNSMEYDKGIYDTLTAGSDYCAAAVPPMSTINGAAQYYSPQNPLVNEEYHKFISDAKGYAFTQTQYSQDNTGRITRQGGVGQDFQIGSGHETKYFYSTPEQADLDALFGTEAGEASHYQKNMVRDANGQYSISYIDMHGRTVATALAGVATASLKQLDSYTESTQTDELLSPVNNIIKGSTIESSKTLLAPKAGNHVFHYSLQAESLTLEDCKQQNICYDCLYDLDITITDDCGNKLLGGKPYTIRKSNFKLFEIDTTCNTATPIDVTETVFLQEGNYNITKKLSISEEGMAYYRDSIYLKHNTCKTYEEFFACQMQVIKDRMLGCSTDQPERPTYLSYREQMKLDMAPLVGQYGNTEPDNCYSIFAKTGGVENYKSVFNYVDENGSPDFVLNEQGNLVAPQNLQPDEFIANFKESWLDALVALHPEYRLLEAYEGFKDSHIWDEDFNKTDTYVEAVAKGYLNPFAIQVMPASRFPSSLDPLFRFPRYGNSAMQALINYCFAFQFTYTGSTPYLTLWGWATMAAKCTDANTACATTWNNNNNVFNTNLLCTGELDMAWRSFRNMYQEKKREWIENFIRQSTGVLTKPVCEAVFVKKNDVFVGYGLTETGNQQNLAVMQDSANRFYDENCKAYSKYWLQQLESCNYTPAQSDVIIKYLVEVCKSGADESHPFGASTSKPGSTYRFQSFDAVIHFVNDSIGKTTDASCNAFLIDRPLPYSQPQLLVQKPLWGKPEACECEKVNSLYKEYQQRNTEFVSFSQYLLKQYKTAIAQSLLDSLRSMCDGTINCKYIPQPIYLPPVLQCVTTTPCIECVAFNGAYNNFKSAFPVVVPTYEEGDTIQQKKNTLFANYMNQQFGFHKTAADYLNFKAECDSAGITSSTVSDSLQSLLNSFKDNYSAISKGQVLNGYKITPGAIAAVDAANAMVKAMQNATLPAGFAITPYTTNFDAKLRSVSVGPGGRHHVIIPFPLDNTLPGDSRLDNLRNNTILATDFAAGPVTLSQLSAKYMAVALFNQDGNFQYMWNSTDVNVYNFYGISTPMSKYLPQPLGVSANDVYRIYFTPTGNTANAYSTNNIKEVKNLRLDAISLTSNLYSAGGLKATVELTNGTQADVFLVENYPYAYIQFKEQADPNLYNSDCNAAFTYYYNLKNGTSYTSSQVDSIYTANGLALTACASSNCAQIQVAATGIAKPESVSCEQLITTYKNFMADFPHPEKGATVKVPASGESGFNTFSMQSFSSEETGGENNTTQDELIIDSIPPRADSIQAPSPGIEGGGQQSFSMQSNSFSSFNESAPLADTYLEGKYLLEWYFNTHLNISGYTYNDFMDWLVNGCGYKLHQLPLDSNAAVCCDTLQTLLNSFSAQYPGTSSTITETITVPVHKVIHIYRKYNWDGTVQFDYSFHSNAALSAATWTDDDWFVVRDNVSFNFNVLPQNATINNAALNLYAKPEQLEFFPCCGAHYRRTTDNVFGIFDRLTGLVVPGQTILSTQPATDTTHRFTLAPISISNGASPAPDLFSNENYLNQNCTQLVTDLYQQAADNHNYGMLFKLNKENLSYKAYNFWSNAAIAPVAKLPNLQVSYTASRCDVFASYVNNALGTHLTNQQINELFGKCGITETPCGSYTRPPVVVTKKSPRLCGQSEPMNEIITSVQDDPCDDSTDFAIVLATELQRLYKDSLTGKFNDAYTQKCLNAVNLESFSVTHPVSEYHYTLYYYDQAGNLVKTVSPEGVHPNRDAQWLADVKQKRKAVIRKTPAHTMATVYRYNSLNQVVSQTTPDAGESRFWYDRLGRLVVSQNAKQKKASKYSYTKYDATGRITEVGEKLQGTAITQTITRDATALRKWIDFANRNSLYTPKQVTVTAYDAVSNAAPVYAGFTPFKQKAYTLRNRVSYTRYIENTAYNFSVQSGDTTYTLNDITTVNSGVEYSYDIHGNVDSLLNIYGLGSSMLTHAENRYKYIAYKYDLISGKVNEVHYQAGFKDEFYHRYGYDGDNRLTDVYTTGNKLLVGQIGLEEHEAFYQYYKHGPLARAVIGHQQVQGLDYAYTLQGWLKGVNSISLNPDYDMGGDGKSGAVNKNVGRDAYGFNLNYYTAEYSAINQNVNPFPGNTGFMPSGEYKPLYNGNISSMAVNIGKLAQPQLYNYGYDQLNRLIGMNVYRGLDQNSNSWSAITIAEDYKERISYDANGNIKDYFRNGAQEVKGTAMDNMHYAYNKDVNGNLINNKLRHVTDDVLNSLYTEDIESQIADNYEYDEIGNLVKDQKENIQKIAWNVYGKIQTIEKVATAASDIVKIDYSYDPSGNRIGKSVTKASGNNVYTAYVRDASGNVMAMYEVKDRAIDKGILMLTEQHLYGSSRLGIVTRSVDMDQKIKPDNANLVGATYTASFERGTKVYELTNHLGNVLVTVSDKKIGVNSNNITIDYYTADVVSAQDFYPFGMKMVGRTFSASGYRYGFNGKEEDDEGKGDGNQQDYGMRIYDPRLGRFLSVDPLTKKYPELTPYQFASNRPIDGIDEDGLEWAYHDKDNKQVDINSTTTNADKLRITGVRWVGYDTDKDGSKIPKPGTVKTAYIFGAKGMTFHMTTSNEKPYNFWISYENMGTGNTSTDKKLSTLHSSIQNQMKSFILKAQYRFGIDLRVTDGFRSVGEQDKLYAKHRTEEQIEAEKKKRGITRTIDANPNAQRVTNAIGGYSNHNFGLAIDVVPYENGNLNWNTKNYPIIGLIGESRGLEWGHRWKKIDDNPHFQNLQGKTLKELRALPKDDKGLPIIQ